MGYLCMVSDLRMDAQIGSSNCSWGCLLDAKYRNTEGIKRVQKNLRPKKTIKATYSERSLLVYN